MISKIARSIKLRPKSLSEFAFYSNRLKKEKSIRTMGFVFMALTLLVQMVAATIPAEQSFAASNNDIIRGGVSSKKELVDKCNSDAKVKAIYAKFGVTCAHIASGTTREVTITSGRYDYWSMGHSPSPGADVRLSAGSYDFYYRPLSNWGNGVRYATFNVKANGKNYYIIKNCGNLTTVKQQTFSETPEPPKPKVPKFQIKKELITPADHKVKPGDTVTFKIFYRNTVAGSIAKNFILRDFVDDRVFEDVKMAGKNATISGDPARKGNLGHTPTLLEAAVTMRVKQSVQNGELLCNYARVSSDNSNPRFLESNKSCVRVVIPPPPVTPPAPPPETPPQETPKCTVPGKEDLPVDDPGCKEDERFCLECVLCQHRSWTARKMSSK